MKKRNVLTIIVGIALIFITLTNLPNMSQEDRRHLPLSTYTTIGKLLTCEDLITNPIRADIERVKCVPGTGSSFLIQVASSMDHYSHLLEA